MDYEFLFLAGIKINKAAFLQLPQVFNKLWESFELSQSLDTKFILKLSEFD